jgi:membrane protein required for colicin V production
MIAAALSLLNSLSVNWFDVVVILMLVFGIYRGRKNGMSKEMIPVLTWVTLFIVCGSYYKIVARTLKNAAGLGDLTSFVLAYIGLAVLVYLIFSLIKNALAKKLETSNLFGNAEFYLGMPAGMVRFACILLTALALLNAKHYTAGEIAAHDAFVNQNFGGDLFAVADVHTIQEQVFKKSLTGPLIKKILGPLFIDTAPPGGDQKAPVKKPVIQIGNPVPAPTH